MSAARRSSARRRSSSRLDLSAELWCRCFACYSYAKKKQNRRQMHPLRAVDVGLGQFEQPDARPGRDEALEIPIHPGHVEGHRIDLLGAARPGALGGAPFLL